MIGFIGMQGTSALIAIVAEPAGANCTNAGSQVTSGLDSNANSVLDASEITTTRFICNGAPGPGVTWNEVTSTAVQALPNNGYLANNAAQVVITLPTTPTVGSIVRISGTGVSGWRLAQNAGQSVQLQGLPNNLSAAAFWTPRDSSRNWQSLASSADGSRLVAGAIAGQLYTSTDSGVSWTPRESNRQWGSVALSADGTKLVAGDRNGKIYTSRQNDRTTPGVAGFISGAQYDALELVYTGNGLFVPLSHHSYSGLFTVN